MSASKDEVNYTLHFLRELDDSHGDMDDFGCAMVSMVGRMYPKKYDEFFALFESMSFRTEKKMKKKYRSL